MEDAQEVWSVGPLLSRVVWCVWSGVGWVGVGVCYAIFRGASSEGVGLQAVEEEQTDGTRTQEGARQGGGRQMPRRVRATCSSMIL